AVLALLVVGVSVSGVRADESHGARRLLVRLDEEHVEALAAWVATRGGRLVDLDTLEPVAATSATAVQAESSPPPLRSAVTTYQGVLSALASSAAAADQWSLGMVRVGQARIDLTLMAANPQVLQALREAVETALATEQGATVEMGGLSPQGEWVRSSLTASLPVAGSPDASPPLGSMPEARKAFEMVHTLASAHGLQLERASAERLEARSQAEGSILGREFVFRFTDRANMLAYVTALESKAAGLLVTEIMRRDAMTSERPQQHAWQIKVAVRFRR
ncbi:MAG: hypothetical protein R3F05_20580, partial [Planctomycetota bacterium]